MNVSFQFSNMARCNFQTFALTFRSFSIRSHVATLSLRESPPASAVATLKIATDISMVTATLKATICKSVSTTLAFDFARCAVAGARAGSSIVDISIAPDAAQARACGS